MRAAKTVGSVKSEYYYLNGQPAYEKRGENTSYGSFGFVAGGYLFSLSVFRFCSSEYPDTLIRAVVCGLTGDK